MLWLNLQIDRNVFPTWTTTFEKVHESTQLYVGLIHEFMVKIRKTTHSISPYLYNALQIQPQILVQITSNSYAAELQN